MTKRINVLYSFLLSLRNRHFFFIDIVTLLTTTYFTFFMMYRGNVVESISLRSLLFIAIAFLIIKLSLYTFLGLYRQLWRYASVDDMARLIIIGGITMVAQGVISHFLLSNFLPKLNDISFYFPFIDAIFSIFLISFTRFSIRLVTRVRDRNNMKFNNGSLVLIAGAGKSGVTMLEEMRSNISLGMIPIGFVDDDPVKQKLKIRGVPVLGSLKDIPSLLDEYNVDTLLLAMPSAPGRIIKNLVTVCEEKEVKTFTVPGVYEILNGKVNITSIREIRIEDLLRREMVQTDTIDVEANVKGRTVLITGAGGSIGSELCRQIFSFGPKKMVLLGHGENSIFDIENELIRRANKAALHDNIHIDVKAVIADLRFEQRVNRIFEEHQPEVVFHAAAHKHVPLMEKNPSEAITNNILGMLNLVNAAVKYDVQKFVGISTDKAVNPTNIMGASKRITEMILLKAAKETGKYFSAVRFGNVLGSRGSVVRTFKKQIKNGGPITITHPDIKRYFMTIPEAVQLVLQASVLGAGGSIFVLDMGEPIKIVDMARDMIKLSGLKEGEDIEIEFSGLRPGEKLFEELFIPGENYTRTKHEKIFIADNASKFINAELDVKLNHMIEKSNELGYEEIVYLFKDLIPEYKPNMDGILKPKVAG